MLKGEQERGVQIVRAFLWQGLEAEQIVSLARTPDLAGDPAANPQPISSGEKGTVEFLNSFNSDHPNIKLKVELNECKKVIGKVEGTSRISEGR